MMSSHIMRSLASFFLFALILPMVGKAEEREFDLRSGVLDLTDVDPDKFESLGMRGQAEFFWHAFIVSDGVEQEPVLLDFPGAWNLADDFPAHGYGSYRVTVRLPKVMPISLRFDSLWTSSEIYVDEVLVKSNGKIGRNAEESTANLGSGWIYTFTPKQKDFSIILQISNFDLFLGGAVSEVSIGSPNGIVEKHSLIQAKGSFLIGALFIMGFYHIALFLLRPEDRSSLYYGIFSILVCAHIGVGDPAGFVRLLNDFTFRQAVLTYNISWMLATSIFCLYAQSLFPSEYSRRFAIISTSVSVAFIGFMSLTDVRTFIFSTQVYQLIMLVCIVYSVVAIIRAAAHKREGALAFVFCMAVLMVCSINDMLLIRGVINTVPIGPAGVFVFTFGQSYLLSVRFARAFKALAVSDIEIRKLNESLEEKVELKTRDIRAIMEHVPMGIFSVQGDNQAIDKDYSKYLEKILGKSDLAGTELIPAILSESDLSSDQISSAKNALSASIGEDSIAFESNSHILPNQIVFRKRFIQLSWNAMKDEHETVQKILVTLNDVTELRDLEDSLRINTEELKLIGEIIGIEVTSFHRFLSSCRTLNARSWKLVETLSSGSNNDSIKQIYMNLHTMKGDARTIKLRSFSDFIHELEKPYAASIKNSGTDLTAAAITEHLQSIDDRLNALQKLSDDKLSRNNSSAAMPYALDFDDMAHRILKILDDSPTMPWHDDLLHLYQSIENHVFVPLNDLLHGLSQNASSIAEDLGKLAPEFSIAVPDKLLGVELQEVFRNALVHLLRNSLDHGIEKPQERLQAGKKPNGRIEIFGAIVDNFMEISIQDDGKGLNIARLKSLAESHHYAYNSDILQLTDFIFSEGISTSATVNNISGRGVGLSAVRQFLQSVGGGIQVVPLDTDLNRKFVRFKFKLWIPAASLYPRSGTGVAMAV